MTEQSEGEKLLDDTTGRIRWQCYGAGPRDLVLEEYRRKYGHEPPVVIERYGLWWLGPVPKEVTL
jgi:hypothetical protein